MNHPLTPIPCLSRAVAQQGSVALPALSQSRRQRSPQPATVIAVLQQVDQEVRIFSFFPSREK
jgi:hypothetical protein